MSNLFSFLNGKKTYLIAALLSVVVFLKYAGLIDEQTYQELWALLTAGGLATLRASVNNVERK